MASDLAEAIAAMPLSDTHEHLHAERHYVEEGPDVLQAIFDHYLLADLVVAGDPDIRARFAGVRDPGRPASRPATARRCA